jgi:hypothetical protein
LKCRENFFWALQIAVFQFFFEISEHPKVAWTDVWRVGWMGSSENLQETESIDNSMPIVTHRVIHVHRKIDRGFLAWKTLLFIQQRRKLVLNEILVAVFLSFREGIQGN